MDGALSGRLPLLVAVLVTLFRICIGASAPCVVSADRCYDSTSSTSIAGCTSISSHYYKKWRKRSSSGESSGSASRRIFVAAKQDLKLLRFSSCFLRPKLTPLLQLAERVVNILLFCL